jgi:hypothetical protein
MDAGRSPGHFGRTIGSGSKYITVRSSSCFKCTVQRPPLWSNRQRFWLQFQRSRVRFPALPDFLRSTGSGTGPTQPVWGQLRSYLSEKVAAPVKKTEINGRGDSLRWPRNTLYQQRLALTSPTGGGRSVGIVRLRTTATEFSLVNGRITQISSEVNT